MLFEERFLEPIRTGEVTTTYRRWKAPQAKAGNRQRTAAGLIDIISVILVNPRSITDAGAKQAGYRTGQELRDDLRGRSEYSCYRVEFKTVDESDLLDELVDRTDFTAEELERLTRLTSWSLPVLQAIAAKPEVRAGDLAAELGRDTEKFKSDVRRLKALGLTISFDIGYRLSPRGEAYLAQAT